MVWKKLCTTTKQETFRLSCFVVLCGSTFKRHKTMKRFLRKERVLHVAALETAQTTTAKIQKDRKLIQLVVNIYRLCVQVNPFPNPLTVDPFTVDPLTRTGVILW